jgi:hypothetical protein
MRFYNNPVSREMQSPESNELLHDPATTLSETATGNTGKQINATKIMRNIFIKYLIICSIIV